MELESLAATNYIGDVYIPSKVDKIAKLYDIELIGIFNPDFKIHEQRMSQMESQYYNDSNNSIILDDSINTFNSNDDDISYNFSSIDDITMELNSQNNE